MRVTHLLRTLAAILGLTLLIVLLPFPALAQDRTLKGGLTELKSGVPDFRDKTIVGDDADVVDLIARAIRYALYVVGAIAVVFVIYGGFLYLTSAGKSDQASKGAKTIQYALIGLVIIILSYVIVQVVVNFIKDT